MFFDILTLFPALFESVFSDSIVKRAQSSGLISITIDDIRNYSDNPHRTVDDYPYGGAPGMVMKPRPVTDAIRAARERNAGRSTKVVYLSPQGKLLNHSLVQELSKEESLILLCGRYKGVDQRVIDREVDLEVSIGDYVLSGGELGAMVVVDSVMRLIPGVLGNSESASDDSFYNGILGGPVYTRPEEFEGERVPEILLGGHHANIKKWQYEKALAITELRRPDLLGFINKKENK